MTLALALALTLSAQADTIRSVSASQSRGTSASVAAWTEGAPGSISSVEVLVSPHAGSPSPGADTVRLTTMRAERQVWTVPGVRFDSDARGAVVPARAVLHSGTGAPTQVVELEIVAGRTVCRTEAIEPAAGLVQAELLLDEGGKTGTVRLVLDERSKDVRAIELALGASTLGSAPVTRELRADLDRVEQLWTADLPLAGAGGAHFQIDAVVVDAQGTPFGTSLSGDLVVQTGALTATPPCQRGPGAVAMR